MAQPHKGLRRQVISRIPEEVYPLLAARARNAGCSTSQFIADAICLIVADRPDLARELGHAIAVNEELALMG